MDRLQIVLRTINGVFGGCFVGGGGMPSALAGGQPLSFVRAISVFSAVFASILAFPLMVLAVVAGLMALASHGVHAPAHTGLLAFGFAGETASLEIKKLGEEMKSAFETFKETHTLQETELKKHGTALAETDVKLNRINAALDAIELKAQRRRMEVGVDAIDDEIKEDRERRGPDRKAFSKWARRGATRLNDEERKSLVELKYLDREDGEYKALETDSDVEGGVFVPHQLANRVIQKLILISPFRDIAAVEVIGTGALEIPKEGATNFAAGWVGERGARSQTQTANLGMERIPVHEMFAEPPVSQTQLDDSVFDIETWLSSRVATALAQVEGLGFIKGNSVTSPEGVATSAAVTQSQTIAAASFTGSAGADILVDMWSGLPTFYANAASWILNRATLGKIRKLKDNNNQYLWAPGGFGDGVRSGFAPAIMGQSYAEMPDMDSVAAGKTPIMLGNFKMGYQVVDRLGMRVIRDNLTAKPFVLFYTTKRVGGQVVLGEAITKLLTT